ncbi:MAG: hypothetical protein J6T62_03725 [Fibrobacter sp.]|nr:hypothetical protein [Fibrobacter sp.]
MQRNERSQQLFDIILRENQIFDVAGNVMHNAQYNNNGNYSIASLFMRSEKAPQMTINHVLVENGTEQQAFNRLLDILKTLNPKIKPIVVEF